jgi:hypothetical protein
MAKASTPKAGETNGPTASRSTPRASNDQKGRMGEEMVRSAFTLHGYKVVPTGIEHTDAVAMNDKWVQRSLLFNVLRHAPDFLIAKKKGEETKSAFIEVKYWPSATTQDKLNDLTEDRLVENYLGEAVGFGCMPSQMTRKASCDPSHCLAQGEIDNLKSMKYRLHQAVAHVFFETILIVITDKKVHAIMVGDVLIKAVKSMPSGLQDGWHKKWNKVTDYHQFSFIKDDWDSIKGMIEFHLEKYCKTEPLESESSWVI